MQNKIQTERHQIKILGKLFRSYRDWRRCHVCGYDDLINSQCGGDYYTLNLTICPECGVEVFWED